MKETACVLNVLMFLFQNHMNDEVAIAASNRPEITDRLTDIGFEPEAIEGAFNWLYCLEQCQNSLQDMPKMSAQATRVYSADELRLFNQECRDLLALLNQLDILDSDSTELVINLAMALEDDGIDAGLIKWVTLMTLYNNKNYADRLAKMELLVLNEPSRLVQ